MTPKELPYKDKEITIRDRETIKLSELTKDERDIYFAGVKQGGDESFNKVMATVLSITVVAIFFIITAYYSGEAMGIRKCK